MNDFWEYTPDNFTCGIPAGLTTSNISASSSRLKWNSIPGAVGYKINYKVSGESNWNTVPSRNTSKKISGLNANTDYKWRVKSICGIAPIIASEWSVIETFTTGSFKSGASSDETPLIDNSMEVYPNPLSSVATISFNVEDNAQVLIELYDLAGRKIKILLDENTSAGNHELTLTRSQLSSATYLVKMSVDGLMYSQKIIQIN